MGDERVVQVIQNYTLKSVDVQDTQLIVAIDELNASVISLFDGNFVPEQSRYIFGGIKAQTSVHFLDPDHLFLHQTYHRIQLVNFRDLLVHHLLSFPPLAQNPATPHHASELKSTLI
jgi:hypothetical protein